METFFLDFFFWYPSQNILQVCDLTLNIGQNKAHKLWIFFSTSCKQQFYYHSKHWTCYGAWQLANDLHINQVCINI